MLRLKENKHPQEGLVSQKAPLPSRLVIPLIQHTGAKPALRVKKKDSVAPGSLLAEAESLICANLHSPCAGSVEDISLYNHPVLKKSEAVIIKTQESKEDSGLIQDRSSLSKDEILKIIRQKGIVGLGGAAFPAHVKLRPPKRVDTLIINGCECEPYLTCDYRIMVEKTDRIIKGIEIMVSLLGVKQVFIAIEDNKPQAIKDFNSRIHTQGYSLPRTRVEVLASFYPQGAEKQLIYKIVRRKVPAGGLPLDVGCVVQNVGTCLSVYEAVYLDKPLTERLVTFAGSALKEPKNLWVKIGTLISDLFSNRSLELKQDLKKVISGGPMMGISLDSLDYPIIKGTSGILFLGQKDLDLREESLCIKCARCVDSCPVDLLPLEFARLAKKSMWSELGDFFISDCIECGCCSYVCPAKIPLVQYIKLGKDKLKK